MSYKDSGGPAKERLVERLACPMCGWLRPRRYGVSQRTGKPREVRFDKMDLINAPLWRLERLTPAGRGSHDARIELVDSKTLVQLDDDIKAQIVRQCQAILKLLS